MMRTFDLNKEIEFNERNAQAQSLHSNEEGRTLRFALLPGQEIEDHEAPNSPVHLVILQGCGIFTGADSVERECGEGMMVVFDAGETHSVHALDEKLVYIAFYKENPASHQYDSEHRRMLEAKPQHHDHSQKEKSE